MHVIQKKSIYKFSSKCNRLLYIRVSADVNKASTPVSDSKPKQSPFNQGLKYIAFVKNYIGKTICKNINMT